MDLCSNIVWWLAHPMHFLEDHTKVIPELSSTKVTFQISLFLKDGTPVLLLAMSIVSSPLFILNIYFSEVNQLNIKMNQNGKTPLLINISLEKDITIQSKKKVR